ALWKSPVSPATNALPGRRNHLRRRPSPGAAPPPRSRPERLPLPYAAQDTEPNPLFLAREQATLADRPFRSVSGAKSPAGRRSLAPYTRAILFQCSFQPPSTVLADTSSGEADWHIVPSHCLGAPAP